MTNGGPDQQMGPQGGPQNLPQPAQPAGVADGTLPPKPTNPADLMAKNTGGQ